MLHIENGLLTLDTNNDFINPKMSSKLGSSCKRNKTCNFDI